MKELAMSRRRVLLIAAFVFSLCATGRAQERLPAQVFRIDEVRTEKKGSDTFVVLTVRRANGIDERAVSATIERMGLVIFFPNPRARGYHLPEIGATGSMTYWGSSGLAGTESFAGCSLWDGEQKKHMGKLLLVDPDGGGQVAKQLTGKDISKPIRLVIHLSQPTMGDKYGGTGDAELAIGNAADGTHSNVVISKVEF